MNKVNSPSQGKAGKVMLIWIGRVSPLFKSTDICKTPNYKIFSENTNPRTEWYCNKQKIYSTHISWNLFQLGLKVSTKHRYTIKHLINQANSPQKQTNKQIIPNIPTILTRSIIITGKENKYEDYVTW
jgi:hypothetical protein